MVHDLLFCASRDQNEADSLGFWRSPKTLQKLQTVHFRHVVVGYHEVYGMRFECLERADAIIGRRDIADTESVEPG
jgi:hypothetical protein